MDKIQIKLEEFLLKHGYKVDSFGEIKSGYRNYSYPTFLSDGRSLNFILYKNEDGILTKIRNANLVGDFLKGKGFPARSTFGNLGIIKLSSMQSNLIRYGCFYEYLPGDTINWDGYRSDHIKLTGGMMGNIHRESKKQKVKSKKVPDEIEIQLGNLDRMKNYFSRPEVESALNLKLSLKLNIDWLEFENILTKLTDEEVQTLHMDFVRSNILFSDDIELKITGIIDFEKVAIGPRVLDIARTLAFLIIDCKFKDPKKVIKYFLFNGYQKRGENQLPDLSQLQNLIKFFWLYDLYKFLKYNPYEFLLQNEHFIRTRGFLERTALIDNL
jgi:Ser/Thr protein kinase RdoA (MazF antagonist)